MPGVPWSRGCSNCRKQKKKCVGEKPPCDRCDRLRLACVGLGQQRFKFVGANHRLDAGTIAFLGPAPGLDNAQTRLRSALVHSIDPTLPIRTSLPWNYGFFLAEIPARLGINEALDKASTALMASVDHYRTEALEPPPEVLRKHGSAVAALRRCLEDPGSARATETLCAVQLIMIYQAFLGRTPFVSHCAAIAQILKGRERSDEQDPLENKLMATQRCSLVVEALLDDKVNLSRQQWKELVEDQIDKTSPEGELMRILSRVPDLIRRGRAALSLVPRDHSALSEYQSECGELRNRLNPILASMRSRLDQSSLSLQSDRFGPASRKAFVHPIIARSYALALMGGCFLNRIASSLGEAMQSLVEESLQYSREIIGLAHLARKYRPMGSQYMLACLPASYVATTDLAIEDQSAALMRDIRMETFGVASHSSQEELNWLKRRFSLKETRPYEDVFDSYI